MELRLHSFEKLSVWNESRLLTRDIYELTQAFPKEEMFGLKSQVRRAAVSVGLNIAEGSGRLTGKDQALMYKNAYGSLMEVLAGLILANDMHYIPKDSIDKMRQVINRISFQLNKLSKAALSKY
jgi:four helix bundle protein